jgi:hypothetical protein
VRRLIPLALLVVGLTSCGGGDERATTEAAPARPAETERSEVPVPDQTTTAMNGTTEPAPPPPPAPEALPGVPAWTAGYRGWMRLNAQPLPPRDADPHLGTKNVFTNRPPVGGVYPAGTIIVKEAFRPGRDFIGLIATMRKLEGANPEHNDWVFVEYTREARNAAFGEQAAGAVCWSCHVGAQQADYVWVLTDQF